MSALDAIARERFDPDAEAWRAARWTVENGGALAVAFSGGGDSTALLIRAVARARELGAPLRVFIVDHDLQPGARAVAERAHGFAQSIGAAAEILTWRGEKPASGVQASARAARYRLMCEALHARAPFGALLLGHTSDDQIETVEMRAARPGARAQTLAGMRAVAPAPVWPEGRGVALLRPLLETSRAALRDELRTAGVDWSDDPANENETFERVRVRNALAHLSVEARCARLDAIAAARASERAVADEAAELFEAQMSWRGSVLSLSGEGARALAARLSETDTASQNVARAVLAAAAKAVSGEPGAGRGAVTAAEALFMRADAQATSCAGCVFERLRDGGVRIRRDLGAVLGRADGAPAVRLQLSEGASGVWDGRYLIGPAPCDGVVEARAARAGRSADDASEPVFIDADGAPHEVETRFLGLELAARALFPERPAFWMSWKTAANRVFE